MERKTEITGYLLAVIAAVAYSIKGIFAKMLYAYGVDPITLLALRFAIAMPFFWALLYFYPSQKTGTRDMLMLVLSGLLGLYGAALADFYGLLYIDASIERIILYTYPAMVVLLASIFFKERPGKRTVFSLALTYLGLMLTLKVFSGRFSASYIGAALVIVSAVIYSLSYIMTEMLGRRVSGIKISSYAATAAGAAFIATWHGRYVPHEPQVWYILAALAVVSTVVPVLALTLAIKRIGAKRTALAGFVGPVSTAFLAYIFLGERLDLVQLAGMALVISGVLVISTQRGPAQ